MEVADLFVSFAERTDKVFHDFYPGVGRADCFPDAEIVQYSSVRPLVRQNSRYRNENGTYLHIQRLLLTTYARFFLAQLARMVEFFCPVCQGFTRGTLGEQRQSMIQKIRTWRHLLHESIDIHEMYRATGLKIQQSGLTKDDICMFFLNMPSTNKSLQTNLTEYTPWLDKIIQYMTESRKGCYWKPVPKILQILSGIGTTENGSADSSEEATGTD